MKINASIELLLETAAICQCIPKLTACHDGCNVAWMHNSGVMVGSVRGATPVMPLRADSKCEKVLEAAARLGWYPRLAAFEDGADVAWVKDDKIVGSVTSVSPLNPPALKSTSPTIS